MRQGKQDECTSVYFHMRSVGKIQYGGERCWVFLQRKAAMQNDHNY